MLVVGGSRLVLGLYVYYKIISIFCMFKNYPNKI